MGGNPETLTNAAGVVVFEGTTSEGGGSQPVLIGNITVSVPSNQNNPFGSTPLTADGLSTESVALATLGIPVTTGAGAGFGVTLVAPDFSAGTVGAHQIAFLVSNADGTEKISLVCTSEIALTTGQAHAMTAADWEPPGEQIGTDLSVDGSGHIVSTAGGQFFVAAWCFFTGTDLVP